MSRPITLSLGVDETTSLEQVDTAADVRDAPSSCFAEILHHSAEPAHLLFPDAESHHGGEVPPPRWWSDVRAHISDVHLFKVRDGWVLPASGVVVRSNGDVMRLTMAEAVYASPDLTHLRPITRSGDRSVLTVPGDAPRIEKALVVLPHGAVSNYGHFLLDGMASLAALAATGAFESYQTIVPPLKGWQSRHFELFGTRPTVVADDVLHADEIVYTSAMHHFLHRPNFNYRDLQIRQLAGAGVDHRGTRRRRLYLRRATGGRRVMVSERRLMARLIRAGFEVVDPARLSVDAQIRLFAEAEAVVGISGSAFANALYSAQGTLVVEIQPAGMENHWVLPLCQVMGLRHAAYFCGALQADPLRPEADLTFDLDVDRFLDFAFGFPPLRGAKPRASWLDGVRSLSAMRPGRNRV